MSHRWCRLLNDVENVDRLPDILCNLRRAGGCPAPARNAASSGGSGFFQPNTWFFGLTQDNNPNDMSIGSGRLAQFMVVTSRQTVHTTSITKGLIHALHACDAA